MLQLLKINKQRPDPVARSRWFGCFQRQMKVILHQRESMYVPSELRCRFEQRVQERIGRAHVIEEISPVIVIERLIT